MNMHLDALTRPACSGNHSSAHSKLFRDRTGRPTSASNLRHVERVRKKAPTACAIMANQQAASTILALTPGLMLDSPSCGSTPEWTTDWTSS